MEALQDFGRLRSVQELTDNLEKIKKENIGLKTESTNYKNTIVQRNLEIRTLTVSVKTEIL